MVPKCFSCLKLLNSKLTNEKGKIDIAKPYTQLCIRELMKEMFTTFPQLDGLGIRTGEMYFHDAP